MAFYTGVCNSFDDMKAALISCCVANGWTATTDSGGKDVIYKGNLYVMLDTTTGTFNSFGITGRTGVSIGSAPGRVGISDFISYQGNPTPGPVLFPVKYFCFTYSDIDEVYFLINYADMYQWIAFGKSNIVLPGTGLWVAGTSGISGTSDAYRPATVIIDTLKTADAPAATFATSAAMFWTCYMPRAGSSSYRTAAMNYWLHSNIDTSYPWSLASDNYYYGSPIGVQYLHTHLESQPNQFNQQSLLLPILAYYYSGPRLIAQIQKARHMMINYIDPETIIYHGSEQWMVFPYLRKVYQSPYTFSLYMVNHTGNFGWAIKKEA